MYEILLKKVVHKAAGDNSSDIYLQKRVNIPIPPFPGLWICYDGFEAEIKEVYIDNVKIECYTESDRTRYHQMRHNQKPDDIEEISKEWEEMGWERES